MSWNDFLTLLLAGFVTAFAIHYTWSLGWIRQAHRLIMGLVEEHNR